MEDGFELRVERSSLEHQHSGSFSRGRKNKNLQDNVPEQTYGLASPREYASSKQVGLASSAVKERNSVKTSSSIHKKPWPSRKATGDDEMVKHMSHVPCYLQRQEKGENVQEKALNVGVLDWGLLERWVYHQKCVNKRGDDSCSNSESSLFSTREFNSGSPGSMTSEGQVSFWNLYMGPHYSSNKTQSCGTENSGHVSDHGFKNSSTILDEKHRKPVYEACVDHTRNKSDDHERKYSYLKAAADTSSVSPCFGTSNMMLEKQDTTLRALAGPKNDKVYMAIKIQDSHQSQRRSNNMPRFTEKSKGIPDHVQESLVSRYANFGSLLYEGGMLFERDIDNFSGDLPEDVRLNPQPPDAPNSCPLPFTIPSDQCRSANVPSDTLLQPTKSESRNDGEKQFTGNYPHKNLLNKTDNSGWSQVKAKISEGIKSSDNLVAPGPKWACRSSSLKECISEERRWSFVCSDESNGCKGTKSGKERQSPSRRMIEPILKPTSSLHLASRTSLSRHSHESTRCQKPQLCKDSGSAYGMCKSSNTTIDFISQVKGSLSLHVQESSYSRNSHYDDRSATSSRQAILQLGFRDGHPLYVLSSCDNNILAATISSNKSSARNDVECIYTFLTIDESRKESVMHSNLRNKGKKHQLVSNIVGHLKVSMPKLRLDEVNSKHSIKEFVLLGDEVEAKNQESIGCAPRGENAAVIIEAPRVLPQNLNAGTSSSVSCWVPMAINSGENASLCSEGKQIQSDIESNSVVVILPSAVHSSSSNGKPPPLIQRWRSGGACDCGGWDEGCKLTTLSNKSQECTGLDLDQDHRIELCIQGESLRKDCAFSMLSFKEGLYTIEFQSSISLLQAFAICIAILHSKNPGNHSTEAKSLQNKPIIDNVIRPSIRRTQKAPTSYVCPPISPVGRA